MNAARARRSQVCLEFESLDGRVLPSTGMSGAAVSAAVAKLEARIEARQALREAKLEAREAAQAAKLAAREATLEARAQAKAQAEVIHVSTPPPATIVISPPTSSSASTTTSAATPAPASLAVSVVAGTTAAPAVATASTATADASTTATTTPTSSAITGSTAPAFTPTDSNVADAQNGPLAKAGQDLIGIYQQYQSFVAGGGTAANFTSTGSHVEVSGGNVGVDLNASGNLATYEAALQALGMTIQNSDATTGLVEGLLPISELEAVAQMSNTAGITPVYTPISK